MDTLRGTFGSGDDAERRDFDDSDGLDTDSRGEEASRDLPPAAIGQDERRMQVRAYNHWAGLLGERAYPSIEDLEPQNLPDFGPYSVLLDFSAGIEDPDIHYLGDALAEECGANAGIKRLSDVPARSLLSRITDHYLQIMANEAPIGFEAEFVNQRGASILYRGILLPFSSDDESIDFIYGVINWKEMADPATADELLLEIDQALEADEEALAPQARQPDTIADWADSPASEAADSAVSPFITPPADMLSDGFDEEHFGPSPSPSPSPSPAEETLPDFNQYGLDGFDDEDEDYDEEAGDDSAASYSFASLADYIDAPSKKAVDLDAEKFDPSDYSVEDATTYHLSHGEADEAATAQEEESGQAEPSVAQAPIPAEYEPIDDEPVEHAPAPLHWPEETPAKTAAETAVEADGDSAADQLRTPDPDAGLSAWLASARELARNARATEDRSRQALYAAVSRAYDFSLAAQTLPEEFDALVEKSGMSVQERAPMTPVVKLVFGTDYDKTRLTEYATVLSHAHRIELARGKLADFLAEAEGGLKGVVSTERRLRREESGEDAEEKAEQVRDALASKLRELEALGLDAISNEGPEFALVMVRRDGVRGPVVLGEISDDVPMIERAARKLVG